MTCCGSSAMVRKVVTSVRVGESRREIFLMEIPFVFQEKAGSSSCVHLVGIRNSAAAIPEHHVHAYAFANTKAMTSRVRNVKGDRRRVVSEKRKDHQGVGHSSRCHNQAPSSIEVFGVGLVNLITGRAVLRTFVVPISRMSGLVPELIPT